MAFGSVGAVRDVKQVILAIRLFLAPRGSVQEGWLSGAMGRRDVKACQFSISNQALLSREQKQDGTIFILKRNDSVCQFRLACHAVREKYRTHNIFRQPKLHHSPKKRTTHAAGKPLKYGTKLQFYLSPIIVRS